MMPNARVTTVAALTAVPLVALVIARVAWAGTLPESMAVHWSGSTPDRYGSPHTYFWIALGVTVLATAIAAVVALRSSTSASLWLPATAMLSWTMASTWILSVALTQHAGSAEDARIGPWIIVPLLGVALAVTAYKILPSVEGTTADDLPTLATPLSPDERASWIGHAHGRWAGYLTLAMGVAATVSAIMGEWWIALLFAALVVVGGAFTSITVRIDRRGIAVSSWGVRWKRVPLHTIASATTADLVPAHWGGWGYRITPRGTAVLIRSGEGIAMTKQNGRRFAVTVDSPQSGAALLNSLLAAASPNSR